MHWSDKVRELKERACAKEGVVSDDFDLVCDGQELGEDRQWWQLQTLVFEKEDPILHLHKR